MTSFHEESNTINDTFDDTSVKYGRYIIIYNNIQAYYSIILPNLFFPIYVYKNLVILKILCIKYIIYIKRLLWKMNKGPL